MEQLEDIFNANVRNSIQFLRGPLVGSAPCSHRSCAPVSPGRVPSLSFDRIQQVSLARERAQPHDGAEILLLATYPTAFANSLELCTHLDLGYSPEGAMQSDVEGVFTLAAMLPTQRGFKCRTRCSQSVL
eukprot:1373071-Amphidinium_carterae.2